MKWAYNSSLGRRRPSGVPTVNSTGHTSNLELDESRGTVYFKVCHGNRCSPLGSSSI
ncbi:hypothetical protein [Streptomyces sp. NPDC126503]|uniref:hypothetical protein n=1 Tax=Streptomyces sp. NPDC126503 TaxID=3155315 RepID=UPI00331A426B